MSLARRLDQLLADSAPLLERLADVKPAFSSPAGKTRMARELAGRLPAHRVYVEPFAGSAAVLFAKDASVVEVVNDKDPEIAAVLKDLSSMTKQEVDSLVGMSFVGDQSKYERLYASRPTTRLGRVYRFIYLSKFSMNSGRAAKQFNKFQQGLDSPYLKKRIPAAVERLKNVKVHGEDYEAVCRRYDSPSTVFFLDPPYAGYSALRGNEAERQFDESRFFNMLDSLKGKWLLNYGDRGELPTMLRSAGYRVQKQSRGSSANIMKSAESKGTQLTHIIASNY